MIKEIPLSQRLKKKSPANYGKAYRSDKSRLATWTITTMGREGDGYHVAYFDRFGDMSSLGSYDTEQQAIQKMEEDEVKRFGDDRFPQGRNIDWGDSPNDPPPRDHRDPYRRLNPMGESVTTKAKKLVDNLVGEGVGEGTGDTRPYPLNPYGFKPRSRNSFFDPESMELVKKAMEATWNVIGNDIESGGPVDNETAVETVLDADRLKNNGHDSAAAKIDELIAKNGYDKIYRDLVQNVRLV